MGEVAGFSLHATKADERVKLERLCRYIAVFHSEWVMGDLTLIGLDSDNWFLEIARSAIIGDDLRVILRMSDSLISKK